MQQLLLLVHVLTCFVLVVLVLLQRSKNDLGTLGSASGQAFFGGQGATSFLFKCTAVLATLFFITTLCLNYLYKGEHAERNVAVPVSSSTELPVGAKTTAANSTAVNSAAASASKVDESKTDS